MGAFIVQKYVIKNYFTSSNETFIDLQLLA